MPTGRTDGRFVAQSPHMHRPAAGAVALAFLLGGAAFLVSVTACAGLIELHGQNGRCDDMDLDSLASALGRLHGLLLLPRRGPLKIGARTIPAADYASRTVMPLMDLAGAGNREQLCAALAKMGWYRDAELPAHGLLFSAYYTPTVVGSLLRDDHFRWPLYRRPPGATATRLDTAAILSGALEGRGLELVWLEDAYDALALQIEGSANIKLPDGRIYPIGTDGNNGRPYTNVSKLVADDGRLASLSGAPSSKPGNPKVRAYFAEHPEALARYWGRNPHFVYWKRVAHAGGGKLGPLTGGRAVAVDPSVYPLGSIMLLRPQKGFYGGDGTAARLVVAMDTGAAIRGPGRVDVYFGGDDDETSGQVVSHGSQQGEAYVVLGP
jgi:3D (Asp-Asp-Asp) domain-containing protein